MRAIRLWLRRDRERALRDEINAHLEMDRADRIARGESPSDAVLNARADFGNVGLVQELTRDAWAGIWLDRLAQDIRFGARMLWRTPGFTATGSGLPCLGDRRERRRLQLGGEHSPSTVPGRGRPESPRRDCRHRQGRSRAIRTCRGRTSPISREARVFSRPSSPRRSSAPRSPAAIAPSAPSGNSSRRTTSTRWACTRHSAAGSCPTRTPVPTRTRSPSSATACGAIDSPATAP